jgi:hypothetical protein
MAEEVVRILFIGWVVALEAVAVPSVMKMVSPMR